MGADPRRATLAGRELLLRALLPFAGVWVLVGLLGVADYEHGRERAVGLLVTGLALTVLPARRLASTRLVGGVLLVALVLLVGYRGWQAEQARRDGAAPTIDIGQTTIASVQLVREAKDPYTERIDYYGDQSRPGGTGFSHFAGFKYGPVMTAAYYPGVRSGGNGGYYLTTALALLLCAAAAGAWALSSAGPAAGAGAAALVLAVPFLQLELFREGINDLVPVGLLLLGFALRSRGGRLGAYGAGVALGLSIGAKLLPGALLALPLVAAGGRRRLPTLATAIAVALASHLPALLRSPREVVSNLVLFNLHRPLDRTGLLDGLPAATRPLVRIAAYICLALVLVLLLRRRTLGQGEVAAYSCVALALLFAASPVLHRNWLFWFVPFVAVAVATRVWLSEDRQPGDSARADD
jgi:hypothetical protein